MRRETLLDFFESFSSAEKEFILHDDGYRTRRFTYKQVRSAAEAFASRLQAAGLKKDDRVLIWSENRPEWVAALWGCLLAGIVVVPVDYRASAELLGRIQSASKARLLLQGDETSGGTPEIPVWRFSDFDWETTGPERMPVAVTKDDLTEILFTSGATAEPKGVLIRHRNILANIVPVEREILKYRRYGTPFYPIRFLNLLPLSHMFGQAMATFIPPVLEGVVVFMSGYNPAEILRQVRSRRVSVIVSVPKVLEVLRDHVLHLVPEAAEAVPPGTHWLTRWWKFRRVHRLFGWKFWSFVVGAAPLDPELEHFWSRMGYVVVQGYGLTETAPIVTLNHPFHARKGSVGKAIAGVELRLADDGEILVRGDNVTSGYLDATEESAAAFTDGWFHTGDIGSIDETGQVFIRGRKKEMIVTPEGMNVFPEDVERALNAVAGVRDSAAVGDSRVHAVLVLEEGTDPDAVVRAANAQLEDHQRVRGVSIWPGAELPRTEGTRKLKRRELLEWVREGAVPTSAARNNVEALLAKYVPDRALAPGTSMNDLGISSLERVELLLEIEKQFGVTMDESAYAGAATVSDLRQLIERPAPPRVEPIAFPSWNRRLAARVVRRTNLPLWLLPLARVFLHVRAHGLENLRDVKGPVIFAVTHQSHLDVPALMLALPSRWRYRLAPAMAKEFFDAHFYPQRHTRGERFTNSLNYYLGALMFNAFPLPQREAGAKQAIRYAGDLASEGWSIVIFPEGKITDTGQIAPFQPGVGLLASRLRVPVVPVKLDGLTKVLHRTWKMARPGRVHVTFGAPLRLEGSDYAVLAREVEDAVRKL